MKEEKNDASNVPTRKVEILFCCLWLDNQILCLDRINV